MVTKKDERIVTVFLTKEVFDKLEDLRHTEDGIIPRSDALRRAIKSAWEKITNQK